ncbi:MAG: N-6 DNA methylase [Planctomycetaceae bacterium]|jgi:type I restriction-modification system DNA methylase subunit|nr:N-6 DNA methylase [Planctomycetaceae bacterium]
MSIEQYTESLVLREMQCSIGENSFGYVFPQGDVKQVAKLEKLLQKAGGKPPLCALTDYTQGGNGKAKPEYIITFNKNQKTIIVIECKKTIAKHVSENFEHPKDYAVDGALYYAKFLKEEYHVIAIGVSGVKKDNLKVGAYHWQKGQDEFVELKKVRDILYEPENYIRITRGDAVRKSISMEEIQELALEMHESLRTLAVTEREKPVFIAGILIALKDEDFVKEYINLIPFPSLLNRLQYAISHVLENSDIRKDKIKDIKSNFDRIGRIEKLKKIPLGHYNSLSWYIEELEKKIKPMMDYADNTIDALGIFYHEFVKYSGGDGSGLGIVLTPQHLTEFMCDLAEINKNSKIVDICCGSGTFLVTAMSKMFKNANDKDIRKIRNNSLFGVESDDNIYTLAIANMIVRGDGKSNIIFGDCFNSEIKKELKNKNIDVGLINPPYSQDVTELEFVENMLDILATGGTGVVVVPMSCAIGTKFKETRERLFKKHTLKAVFSMPDDIFYSNNASTNVCVMVWEAHKPHDSTQNSFFGYYKDDGFVKAKKLGRIDKFNKWKTIEEEWLHIYRERETKEGMSAKKSVTWKDEWLCEAYMETDYSKLTRADFEKTVRDYLAFLVRTQQTDLVDKFPIQETIPLFDMHQWKTFNLVKLFADENDKNIVRGRRLKSEDRESGNVKYFSASEVNNGMTDSISNPLFIENDALIYTIFGDCFFVEGEFTTSDDVNIFKHSKLNKYNGLFIATVINQNKYRYRFGRKAFLNKFENETVKIPVDESGKPDWQFMEKYIKTLQYSNKI